MFSTNSLTLCVCVQFLNYYHEVIKSKCVLVLIRTSRAQMHKRKGTVCVVIFSFCNNNNNNNEKTHKAHINGIT